MRLDEILVLDRRQVDTNIQQGTDDSRASAHHGYTSVRNGILIAFGYDCFDQRQQTVYTPSHLHRYGRRIFGHLLNLSRANGLLFLRFLGELEGGEYLIISIAVAVDIQYQFFLYGGSFGSDSLHLCFHLDVLLLAYSQVSHHLGQCCCNRAVQSGDTASAGYGFLACCLGEEAFYCKIC